MCPHCGTELRGDVWPPPIPGQPEGPPPVRFKTGRARGDIVYAIAVTAGFFVVCGIGIVVVPLLYFDERRKYPVYARAMGWSYIACAMVVLGAFVNCTRHPFEVQ